MGTKKTQGLPSRLEATRRRFERWRGTQEFRKRIPDSLWTAAVAMAELYGVNRTAQALRLDYYSLKTRLEEKAACGEGDPRVAEVTTFVELAGSSRAASGECVVELEDVGGAKMRIQLKGCDPPDLAALSRSFWGAES